MTANTARGRIAWHELVTADVHGSHAFYQQALGWKVEAWEQDADYSMFATGNRPLAGVVAEAAGQPHWRLYVATDDLDATLQQATGLGAGVVVESAALPDGGRYAVLTDPQGATFRLFQAAQPAADDEPAKPGEFSWHELATTDASAALDFYCRLVGWEQTAAHDMGPLGTYYIFAHNGRDIGGIFNKTEDMPGPAAWLAYVRVKNVDKAVSKARKAGGTLCNGPMEVPGGDWVAQFTDPQGASFAVHALYADLHPSAAASEPAPQPETIEVTGAAREGEGSNSAAARRSAPRRKKPVARSTARSSRTAAGRKAKGRKPKPARRARVTRTGVTRTGVRSARVTSQAGRRAVKTTKRTARKAAKVRSRTSKASASRSRARAVKVKKKTSARPRKGK